MSKAKQVAWIADRLNGEDGYRYNEIFLTAYREQHLRLHTIMDADRQGVDPHGMWMWDTYYPNIDEMIWAYAARCARRIKRNSHNILIMQQQSYGRVYYRIRLSSADHIGIADIQDSRDLQGRIRGLWYGHTQYADIVFNPPATTDSGVLVYPVVTFFPVYPPAGQGSVAEFYGSKDYAEFNKKRFG